MTPRAPGDRDTPVLCRSLVLFDLDGVLVDSRAAIATSINYALRARDLPSRDPRELHPYIGPPLAEGFAEITGQGPDSATVHSCVEAYRRHYAEASLKETKIVPGIVAALEQLAEQHTLAVATSKSRGLTEPLLEHLELAGHFAMIAAPEPTSLSESKATTIAAALRSFADRPRALMVGDRFHDILGAKAHGLPSVGVRWGIGSVNELELAGADRIAAEPAELPTIVDKLLLG